MRIGVLVATLLGSISVLADDEGSGDIFIEPLVSEQTVEFIGGGGRPVNNTLVDKLSVYQDRDRIDPAEFGAGVKFNASKDFSISVQAGGEMVEQQLIEVDSGSVVFELSY